MTIPPPYLTQLPPHTHIQAPFHQPPIVHHGQSYHLTEYHDNRDQIYSRKKDSSYESSYPSYRDRSPEIRELMERHSPRRSPYGRERQHGSKYYDRGSSPGYIYRNSPGKGSDTMPLRRTSRDNRNSADFRQRVDKFNRHDSRSREGSENESPFSDSEEEIEEEIEVTATESEEELGDVQSKVVLKEKKDINLKC